MWPRVYTNTFLVKLAFQVIRTISYLEFFACCINNETADGESPFRKFGNGKEFSRSKTRNSTEK